MFRSLSRWPQLATLAALSMALLYLGWLGWGLLRHDAHTSTATFSGDAALLLAQTQCGFGPRPAGSGAGWRTGDWLTERLQEQGWTVENQQFNHGNKQLRNVIARVNEASGGPVVVIATHYDTRIVSDRDPDSARRQEPTIGANDGASGTAILLELARSLNVSQLQHRVWLVFLDGEANDGLSGWQKGTGSREFIRRFHPAAVIYADRVGAISATFPQIAGATPLLQEQLWQSAAQMKYDAQFVATTQPGEQDARTIFLSAGIPTTEIAQMDYPAWRTTLDQCDQLDAKTLAVVGRVIEHYLENDEFSTIAPSLKKTPRPSH